MIDHKFITGIIIILIINFQINVILLLPSFMFEIKMETNQNYNV